MKRSLLVPIFGFSALLSTTVYAAQNDLSPDLLQDSVSAVTELNSQPDSADSPGLTDSSDLQDSQDSQISDDNDAEDLINILNEIFSQPESAQINIDATEYSVTDFGADGSDENDDFNAIQAALDNAYRKDSVIRTVNIPDGTYYISDCLIIHSNTTLKLSSGAKIVRLDESKLMIMSADDSGCMAGGYKHASNIEVTGGEWDGNVIKRNYSTALFSFNHATNISVTDTYIHNFCGNHGVIFNATETITVRNVTISDFVDCIVYDASGRTWYQEALHMDYASAEQNMVGKAAPLDNTPCRNITVENCTFRNVPVGVGTHHDYDTLYEDNVKIKSCRFEDINYTCINGYGFRTLTISHCTADNALTFANLRKCQGTVSDNIANLKTEATEEERESVTKGNQLRIMGCTLNVYDNEFSGGVGSGAVIGFNSSVKLSGNTFSGTKQSGLKVLDGSTVNSTENTVSKNGSYGMYISGGSTLISNSDTVSGAAKDGIFASGSSKLEMVLARITSCKGKGINSENTELNISNCTFTKNKDDAVFVASGKGTINNCKITQNAKRGIVVKKASVIANANKVYKNGSAELYFASGAKGKFRLNTIGGGGVSAAATSNISFVKNTYRISEGTLTIKKKSYKYTGKAICPKVTVKFGGKKLSEDDYKVTYTNNKKRGTATVKITGKGEYKGTLTANFTIK